ncbi:hypothetical protein [Kordia sp.]|uniref:hypothetical protein n=1 Tax=Kordia sp. TaxID=1965332 RepID=UPI003D6A46E1
MKKKNLTNLALNKKSISKFDQSIDAEVVGGILSIPLEKCKYFPTNPNSECSPSDRNCEVSFGNC